MKTKINRVVKKVMQAKVYKKFVRLVGVTRRHWLIDVFYIIGVTSGCIEHIHNIINFLS